MTSDWLRSTPSSKVDVAPQKGIRTAMIRLRHLVESKPGLMWLALIGMLCLPSSAIAAFPGALNGLIPLGPAGHAGESAPVVSNAPNTALDFRDVPLAVETTPDGDVWFGMFTDTLSGGAVQYDTDLVYRRLWKSDAVTALAAHPGGDLFTAGLRDSAATVDFIGRIGPDGQERARWRVPGRIDRLAAGSDGTVMALTAVVNGSVVRHRVHHYSADGAPLRDWQVADGAESLAVAPDGTVIVGDWTSSNVHGSVSRYGSNGWLQTSWDIDGRPTGIDVFSNGHVAVAHQTVDASGGQIDIFTANGAGVRVWDVPGAAGEDVQSELGDLAIGAAGDIYLLVQISRTDIDTVVYHFDDDGVLKHELRDVVQVSVGPPPTPSRPTAGAPDPIGTERPFVRPTALGVYLPLAWVRR